MIKWASTLSTESYFVYNNIKEEKKQMSMMDDVCTIGCLLNCFWCLYVLYKVPQNKIEIKLLSAHTLSGEILNWFFSGTEIEIGITKC